MTGKHAAHDLELIAREVSGDRTEGEAQAARDLLASCPACVVLAGDIRAIAAATRELRSVTGQAAAARAPRDFRLTEADAVRLRHRRWYEVRNWASPGRARGLGGALATLGLVGLLIATGLPGLFSAAGGAATTLENLGSAVEAPQDAATQNPLVAAPATDGSNVKASSAPLRSEAGGTDEASTAVDGRFVLAVGSALVLVAGVAMLLWTRTRRRSGP
jgi:hypothetical protein